MLHTPKNTGHRCNEYLPILYTSDIINDFFTCMRNWYHYFTCVRNWYQIFTPEKKSHQFFTGVTNTYQFFTRQKLSTWEIWAQLLDPKIYRNWPYVNSHLANVTYWYQFCLWVRNLRNEKFTVQLSFGVLHMGACSISSLRTFCFCRDRRFVTILANIKKSYYKLCCKQINVYFIFISINKFHKALLNRISHGTDSSRRCDKFDRIFHIRTKVKNTFCGFRVFNPNEFVTH